MNDFNPICVWPLGAELGEGPIWHDVERALYFVDIKGRKIHRWQPDSDQRSSWTTPAQPGFVVRLIDDALLCGMQGGLFRFSPAEGSFFLLHKVEAHLPDNRLNDGHVDVKGRLWFGSMSDKETEVTGSLYRLDVDHEPAIADSGYVITNGPVLSPDGLHLYHTDTLERKIYVFDVMPDGQLLNRKIFLNTEEPGYPDGMAVDVEGCIWVAFFGGWRVDRFSAEAQKLKSVCMPCANITKLAFGGSDLRTLYVTSATKGLSSQQRSEQPLAGGLFTFHSPVAGLSSNECLSWFGIPPKAVDKSLDDCC